ncbi:MAG: hypothetical protein R3Y09_07500 [Clostridia bacterium]
MKNIITLQNKANLAERYVREFNDGNSNYNLFAKSECNYALCQGSGIMSVDKFYIKITKEEKVEIFSSENFQDYKLIYFRSLYDPYQPIKFIILDANLNYMYSSEENLSIEMIFQMIDDQPGMTKWIIDRTEELYFSQFFSTDDKSIIKMLKYELGKACDSQISTDIFLGVNDVY